MTQKSERTIFKRDHWPELPQEVVDRITLVYRILDDLIAWRRKEIGEVVDEEIHVSLVAQKSIRPFIREGDDAGDEKRMEELQETLTMTKEE